MSENKMFRWLLAVKYFFSFSRKNALKKEAKKNKKKSGELPQNIYPMW